MKQFRVSVEDIASWQAVSSAAVRAAKGKRARSEVKRFFLNPEQSLAAVSARLRRGQLPVGEYHRFIIHDPKRREITAAPFVDRVAHHAMVAPMVWPLESWLAHSSFACRRGKGVHAAALYAQRQCRRFPVYLKMDVSGYFENISHQLLTQVLRRRLKGENLFLLIDAVLNSYHNRPAYGLPIGALTSQQFANVYLNSADQWLQAHPLVRAHCRYMDDIVVWCDSTAPARLLFESFSVYLSDQWRLALKPPLIQKSRFGLTFCGYRIFPGELKPGRRRLRRCKQQVRHWQRQYQRGYIDSCRLQQNTDSVMAILNPGQSLQWRRQLVARYGNDIEEQQNCE